MAFPHATPVIKVLFLPMNSFALTLCLLLMCVKHKRQNFGLGRLILFSVLLDFSSCTESSCLTMGNRMCHIHPRRFIVFFPGSSSHACYTLQRLDLPGNCDNSAASQPILSRESSANSPRFEAILQKCQTLESRIKDFNLGVREGKPPRDSQDYPSSTAEDSGDEVRLTLKTLTTCQRQ